MFQKIAQSQARILLNVGSSRSSKTYSLLQHLIIKALQEPGVYSVVRKTLPALKSSAYRDFLEILKNNDLYNPNNHNKSELIYKLGESEIEFFSVDQYDKVKGRKRKDLLINEGNELSYDDFVQLSLRTTGRIYIDLNPSHDNYHWIETKIKTRSDVELTHSTYKDNPFLDQNTINEIERLKDTDQNLWRIYGLGEMGVLENLIYNHWQLVDKLPDGEKVMGLDFGYNDPSAMTEVVFKDDDIYVNEVLYETRLTNRELIGKMKSLEISQETIIYADSEDPSRIKEIQEAGFNVYPADKGKGSVKKGIDDIKGRGFYITKNSANLQKELRAYKWKEKDNEPTEEPVKFNDHLCLSGDTIIETLNGDKKIKDVLVGDYVRSQNGYNKVIDQAKTKSNAKVVKIDLSDGRHLIGTPDHPIYTTKGKKGIDSLRYDDMIMVLQDNNTKLCQKQLFSIIIDIIGMGNTMLQLVDVLKEGKDYIKQSGKITTKEKSQEDIISTIKTGTQKIIILITLNLSKQVNTYQNTLEKNGINQRSSEKNVTKEWIMLESMQTSGTDLQKELNSTKELEEWLIKTKKSTKKIVSSAEEFMKLMCHQDQSFATIIAKQELLRREDVYNITVENDNNYYANGILVKNCDSMRYAVHSHLNKSFIGFI